MFKAYATHENASVSARGIHARSRWVWLLAAVVLGVAGYAVVRLRASDAKAPTRLITAQPLRKTLETNVTTSGTVRLRSGAAVRVGSQVSGIVRQLNVTVGSRIAQGEVIARIDPTQLEAQVAQSRAQLAIDRVAAAKARRDLDRVKGMVGLVLSREQFEDLNWQLKSADAKVAKSEADLKAALDNLGYATIRAPISGVVSSVTTQQGETVAASFAAPTFVTIVRDKALELLAMVDETDIGGIRPGDPVSFTVEAFPAKDFAGTVERIDPTATIVSGVVNYPVIASINSDTGLLKPDMTANVVIDTGQRSALEIPTAAIQRAGEQRYVYVRVGDRTIRRNIVVSARDGNDSEIAGGLSGNENVVVRGTPASSTEPPTQ